MKKLIIVFFIFTLISKTIFAQICADNLDTKSPTEKSNCLSSIGQDRSDISPEMLPIPYDYLLTQPLMTKGIENYYQRIPIIQTICALNNIKNNTYSRSIIMLIDNNKIRNNAELAQNKKESTVVELAFIKMNFSALPKSIITDILETSTPFGALLAKNNIKVSTTNRTYFSTKCNKKLVSLTRCKLNSFIYGRTNTLIRVDNRKWLADVVEILPGFLQNSLSKSG